MQINDTGFLQLTRTKDFCVFGRVMFYGARAIYGHAAPNGITLLPC